MIRPNGSHRLYRGLTRLLLLPALAWFCLREPGYRARLRERLGFIDVRPRSFGGILVHAASVGEVQAARPLMDALLDRWPDHALTLSTMTPTGAATAHTLWGDRVRHVFLPLDTPGSVGRFLDRLRPHAVVLLEREIWPELLLQCHQRLISVALVNARLTESSTNGYRRWPGLTTPIWSRLGLVAAADQASLDRLASLGVPSDRLHLCGNLKFDNPGSGGVPAPIEALAGRRIFVAGSTHDDEETALLPLWKAHAERHPDHLLILVPRHPQRFDMVSAHLHRLGIAHARRSRQETPDLDTSVWLADTMGELPRWYGMADVCFIGGTLSDVGGHNPLEAMSQGKPVLFGPHTRNFDELFRHIEDCGAGVRVRDATGLLVQTRAWLTSPNEAQAAGQAAIALVSQHQGATPRTLQVLNALWGHDVPAALTDVRVVSDGGREIWFDPQRYPDLDNAAFAPKTAVTPMATGSGRGQAHQFPLMGHPVLLRHYRRGGLMARISEDTYRGRHAATSRAMQEFALLRLMRSWDLPVPAPAAARFEPVSLGRYRADIIVDIIPGTHNLVQLLQQAALDEPTWLAVGRAIRSMHDRQVCHTDLNAHNLLLDAAGRAWIVDFDKCGLRPGEAWKAQNLQRLLRSFRKESTRCPQFFWTESDWDALFAGYGPPATPD